MFQEEAADSFPAKHPSATLDYAVNFEQECARKWDKWIDVPINTRIRVYGAGNESGYEFEATTGGRTAGRSPRWPTALNATVTDGSVIWTARAMSTSSLTRTITGTPTWTTDAGITASGATINGLIAIANISGGADGNDYVITVAATLSDSDVVPKTVILPVRIPTRVSA